MRTDTGELVSCDALLPDLKEIREAFDKDHIPDVDRWLLVPPVVQVPASYLPLSPQQRLALAFGAIRGKDRKAAHRGQHEKSRTKDRRARYIRAENRARKAGRALDGQAPGSGSGA